MTLNELRRPLAGLILVQSLSCKVQRVGRDVALLQSFRSWKSTQRLLRYGFLKKCDLFDLDLGIEMRSGNFTESFGTLV